MFSQIPERRMHWIRWVITAGWLLLIASLLYDPISPWLTQPDNSLSPLRLNPTACIQVQGKCLPPQQPYALGASLFWGAIVPASIFILLVFGHELWRRICPLSFLSQIPRALGWQRQFQRVNEKTGKIRLELAKVKADSWLGRNYLYLQFGLLFLGLCLRLLFIDGNRLLLAGWLILTIVGAIAVGYFYGGKTWCQYFCPMAPVQKIYSEPAGLLTSKAHIGDQQITQSMCRTVTDGKEQSACVACQNPCIDIDAERSYWDSITRPEQKFLYYGYCGLVVGYFSYYYLYAGNWGYYFSGAWARQTDQLATLLNPGLYLFNTPIPIPKLIAVPLTLGLFSAGGYGLGRWVEHYYQGSRQQTRQTFSREVIQHRIFTLWTFLIFNFFFIFAGRPLILLLPLPLQSAYEAILVVLSTLWLYRTWQRHPDRYTRESLASRLRRQLGRLQLNLAQFMEGRSLETLSTDEVYVLAKVLPGFTQAKRHEAYKGVLREALEEGYVNTSSSLEVLKQIREELTISDDEHRQVLEELGVEDPALLDPNRQRSLENQVRLTGYRKAMERMLALQLQTQGSAAPTSLQRKSLQALLDNEPKSLRALRREYSITPQEQDEILQTLDPQAQTLRRAEFLLQQLGNLIERYRALHQPRLPYQSQVLSLLWSTILQKQRLLVNGLLEILEHLDHEGTESSRQAGFGVARSLANLGCMLLQDILEESDQHPEQPTSWTQRLSPDLLAILHQVGDVPLICALDTEIGEIAGHLEVLVVDPNPIIQAVSLYLLYQVEADRGRSQATTLLNSQPRPPKLLLEVAEVILKPTTQADGTLTAFTTLEKLVYLFNSDFFGGVHSETLIELASLAVVKDYDNADVITEAGDTCRELLLLMEGAVEIQRYSASGDVVSESLMPGYVLDELEVLSHTELANTIVAQAAGTRVLAVPVDALDALLDRDHDFARRVLEMESRRLQQLIQV